MKKIRISRRTFENLKELQFAQTFRTRSVFNPQRTKRAAAESAAMWEELNRDGGVSQD